MFAPKQCDVEEKISVFWLSHEELVMQLEVRAKNVPFSDTFVTRIHYGLKMVGKEQCHVIYSMHLDFSKSPMFKSKIVKAATDENTDFGKNRLVPHLREYIPIFAKSKAEPVFEIQKIKKTIKRKKATIRPEILPSESVTQEITVSAQISDVQESLRLVQDPELVANIGQSEVVKLIGQEAVASQEVSSSLLELKEQLRTMTKQQSTMTEEIKHLRLTLYLVIAVNMLGMMLLFAFRR